MEMMTFIKLEDITNTLKKAADEQKNHELYAMIGFVIGMVERVPKYYLPEDVLEGIQKLVNEE